jgi:hypothetical protein
MKRACSTVLLVNCVNREGGKEKEKGTYGTAALAGHDERTEIGDGFLIVRTETDTTGRRVLFGCSRCGRRGVEDYGGSVAGEGEEAPSECWAESRWVRSFVLEVEETPVVRRDVSMGVREPVPVDFDLGSERMTRMETQG